MVVYKKGIPLSAYNTKVWYGFEDRFGHPIGNKNSTGGFYEIGVRDSNNIFGYLYIPGIISSIDLEHTPNRITEFGIGSRDLQAEARTFYSYKYSDTLLIERRRASDYATADKNWHQYNTGRLYELIDNLAFAIGTSAQVNDNGNDNPYPDTSGSDWYPMLRNHIPSLFMYLNTTLSGKWYLNNPRDGYQLLLAGMKMNSLGISMKKGTAISLKREFLVQDILTPYGGAPNDVFIELDRKLDGTIIDASNPYAYLLGLDNEDVYKVRLYKENTLSYGDNNNTLLNFHDIKIGYLASDYPDMSYNDIVTNPYFTHNLYLTEADLEIKNNLEPYYTGYKGVNYASGFIEGNREIELTVRFEMLDREHLDTFFKNEYTYFVINIDNDLAIFLRNLRTTDMPVDISAGKAIGYRLRFKPIKVSSSAGVMEVINL